MKKVTYVIIAALFLLILLAFIGCGKTSNKDVANAQENAVEAQQDADVAVAENAAQEEWQIFKTQAEAMIAANDKVITAYKTKMTYANGKQRANYDKKIDELQLKNKELKDKLDNYKDDGKTTWEQFKSEFNNDMEKLGTALKGFTVEDKK